MGIKLTIGDGSTGVHWRQTDGDEFFLDLRFTPRQHAIGADASEESADPDVSIKFTNTRSIGVMIWALSEILQRMR